jgi:predicted nuclease of restriction endonuclease-like (RecB) superfamily
MNEFEENKYLEIKEELLQSKIDKKVDNYFLNRNELSHYYNVGKMIIDAQGGESRAKYGDELIKKFSERLTKELGKGFNTTTLKRMRQFYLIIERGAPLGHQLTWSHYRQLLPINNINEISYYVNQITIQHWSKRELQNHIRNKEYQRLDDKTKNKLINKQELDIYDNIKNPIYINTFGNNKTNIEERVLKSYILKDLDNFLKQLGNGFCYIENEYKIQVGKSYNYIDILLFNYIYNCFIVVELKVTNSKKDHLGQIMVYMNYVDRYVKRINQDKTIGIIVCKKDDRYLIEYSSDERIKITTYELV